ncbi:MAG TPA: TetR/AcrR family transcriptional regulator [Alphaproteobacteria bacterium]|nr:TetR/AcrR family transcriptional regulator [Alphaproteobacteria bacterium]
MNASRRKSAHRGGRPSRLEAERLKDRILDAASALFLTQGYGATSIESVAARARVGKRTLYARFRDKAELFGAVVHRLIARLRPAGAENIFLGGGVEEILVRLADAILLAALTPEALALFRMTVAEGARFPELAAALDREGARREAIDGIARFLGSQIATGALRPLADPAFAAEEFLQLVVSVPQRRALGLGAPMTEAELRAWARNAVNLFLEGCGRRG